MVAFFDATASGMRVLMLMVSSLFYFYYGGNYNVHQDGSWESRSDYRARQSCLR